MYSWRNAVTKWEILGGPASVAHLHRLDGRRIKKKCDTVIAHIHPKTHMTKEY